MSGTKRLWIWGPLEKNFRFRFQEMSWRNVELKARSKFWSFCRVYAAQNSQSVFLCRCSSASLSQYQASNLPGVDLQVEPLRQPGQARVSRANV